MIYRLDRFPENRTNPITRQAFDRSQIILTLTDSDNYRILCGSNCGCAYTVEISRTRCGDWKLAVGDFIDFHEANDKNAILIMSEADFKLANEAYVGHKYNEPFLRENEPSVLIHCTPMDSWEKIKREGSLKSWNKLKAEKAITEKAPIGSALGDPIDFSDYIMFGSGVTGEIVVNSKQRGKIVMDENARYYSGARLYFDAAKIARDGLLIRDGCHLKVKDRLPLSPYLIWVATWETVGLENQVTTPKIFAEQADRYFQTHFTSPHSFDRKSISSK